MYLSPFFVTFFAFPQFYGQLKLHMLYFQKIPLKKAAFLIKLK